MKQHMNHLKEGKLWRSILFDLAFVAGSILLVSVSQQLKSQFLVVVFVFIVQLLLYGYLKKEIFTLYLKPGRGFIVIALTTLAFLVALTGVVTVLMMAIRAGVQEQFQKLTLTALLLVVFFFGYPLLQRLQQGIVMKKKVREMFTISNKIFGLLLAELVFFALLYGFYRLIIYLLPWNSVNVLFQILTVIALLVCNGINRASIWNHKV